MRAESWVEVENLVPMNTATFGLRPRSRLTSTCISLRLSKRTIRPPIRKVSPGTSEAAKASSTSPRWLRLPRIRTFSVSLSWIVPRFIRISWVARGSRSCHRPSGRCFSRCQRS